MNEKEAIENLKKFNAQSYQNHEYFTAKGYLECLEKTGELERIIREHHSCICNPQNDITCIRCDTLFKWEKEK